MEQRRNLELLEEHCRLQSDLIESQKHTINLLLHTLRTVERTAHQQNGIIQKPLNDMCVIEFIVSKSTRSNYFLDFALSGDIKARLSLFALNRSISRCAIVRADNTLTFKYPESNNCFFFRPQYARASFNSNIVSFSTSITHLDLENLREIDLLSTLPSSLKSLRLPQWFNDKIDKRLPPNLEELRVGDDFDQTVDGLPMNLKKLWLGIDFSHRLDQLPQKLEELRMACAVEHDTHNLPRTLKHLTCGIVDWNGHEATIDNLPPGLTELIIPFYPKPLIYLPVAVQRLECSSQQIRVIISGGCTSLMCLKIWIDESVDTPLLQKCLDTLPKSLLELTLENFPALPLEHLPTSLKVLSINNSRTSEYDLVLPVHLVQLNLGGCVPNIMRWTSSLRNVSVDVAYFELIRQLAPAYTKIVPRIPA
eukprot:TRINITY_DN5392_c0_g1_i1.p1 TRINITY_DN5392_c0_g1~~TRINITY_DN5392_c0_g1_i1.p1  ORF type:complete len:422 (-),score=36.27 TRINITY_DN5392_c0_g1_i1:107-1372(-)